MQGIWGGIPPLFYQNIVTWLDCEISLPPNISNCKTKTMTAPTTNFDFVLIVSKTSFNLKYDDQY